MTMKVLILLSLVLLARAAGAVPDVAYVGAPIVVSGTVADEASKAALLARVREVYGAERVIDQVAIGVVSTPANWNVYLNRVIGPHLKHVTRGQLSVDGNAVSLQGEVASDAQRQQIGALIMAGLNPTYSVSNGLRVVASQQAVLDAALAERIIEFESGKATLTGSGKQILDQMSVAMLKLKDSRVAVIGHTDNAGARAANLALSQARAHAVKDYVIGKGVPGASISVSGEGPDRPVADNRSPAGRARNRRIEFKVAP